MDAKRLSPLFKQNTTVVTVTQRLASYLRQGYDAEQITAGKQAWPSIDILPFNAWINRCWENTHDTRLVLNDFQELTLWQNIITASPHGNSLLRLHATAQSAQQAWKLLQQWQLSPAAFAPYLTPDSQAFSAWVAEFAMLCEQNHWLSRSCLASLLTEQLTQQQLKLSNPLLLAGFDQIQPQYQQLLAAIKTQVAVDFLTTETDNHATLQLIALNNNEQELYAMAQFARHRLEQNKRAVIGCVVPDLTSKREQVERIFAEVFTANNSNHNHSDSITQLFNISAAQSLRSYPLIETAFIILQLTSHNISLRSMSYLITSPFIAGAEQELTARAALLKALYEKNLPEISLHSLLALAQQPKARYYCPLLCLHLQQLVTALRRAPASALPNQWAVHWQEYLQLLGWPGERQINSPEYQQAQRWLQLLDEFKQLANVHNSCDVLTALQLLEQLASDISFQPQSETLSVQIMGGLEAAGLTFDHLWVMGLDDKNWPPISHANPFIPFALQYHHEMPHANLDREINFYRALTARLAKSASEVVFSYATQAEESPLRPSPLIAELEATPLASLNLPQYHSADAILWQAQQLETLLDQQAPPVSPEEKIAGGANLFKYQAACPFQAFAKLRLHADSIEPPHVGLDARERGNLLHDILARFWQLVNSHEQLLRYSEVELKNLIATTITASLAALTAQKPAALKKYFTANEQTRLEHLLWQWLALEKQRQPFTVVALEQTQLFQFGQREIKLRIDRIDQLDDGSGYVILDYKTGKTSIEHWLGDRLDAPQLPLYCIAQQQPVSTIAFGQLQVKELKFAGISINPDSLPNITPINKLPKKFPQKTWEELVNDWRQHLTKLGENFCQGEAQVAPKDLKKTCQHCDLTTLCRVTALPEEDENTDEFTA